MTRLAVCNLPDNRLEIFDITSGKPVSVGAVPVGLDPITVRFCDNSQAWVVNFISDSISIVDVASMRVVATVRTANEPSDVVFAGNPRRAFVSCSQPNLVQVFNPITLQLVTNVAISGNRPRAMDVSPDGTKVYAGIFESGNASTIIGVGVSQGLPRANPIDFPFAPSGGLNPRPNSGTNFIPTINPSSTNSPPRVGLIVKKGANGRWMDDNRGDWTEFIRGTNAPYTGRIPGWDVPDHDLAVIDAGTFAVNYANGLMNICMAVAVNPVSGKIAVIGTDALNQIRFESALKSRFIAVKMAMVDPFDLTGIVTDLNPHIDYSSTDSTDSSRTRSLGDPRSMVWSSDGSRGYVAGMGSDNVVTVDSAGNRIGSIPSIDVGEGPTGLALDEVRGKLYVYNRFAGSLVTVDTSREVVTATLPLPDPTPTVVKKGRPFLYNTHRTSGLGQAACGSCHIDARFDRLAWDLGEPSDPVKRITNANFVFIPDGTNHFHPMKGPMTTQTLQDIIGHEPFHWRGDRDGIENFNPTFTNLQGAHITLSVIEMQELKDFLATIRFGPNPYRTFSNGLPSALQLPGLFTLGRGALPAGSPLPSGNAEVGQAMFRQTSDLTRSCIRCHTLPTGLGTDLRFIGGQWVPFPGGTNSSHHIALIELERSMNLPFKVPQLRNLFEKSGFSFSNTNSLAGFGLSHDGSVDSIVRFIQDGFAITNDQQTADLAAFLLAFTGSDLLPGATNNINRSPGVASLDTPASAGFQTTISNSSVSPLIETMIGLANSTTGRVDLVAKGFKDGVARGWFFDRAAGKFQSDRKAEALSTAALRTLANPGSEQTYTLVPRGTGRRIGIDRDADGYLDQDEIDFGSDPANPLSLATNTPPKLAPIPDLTVLNGSLTTWQLIADDADLPAQSLVFGLANPPPGADVNPTNGLFTWIQSRATGNSTNSITVFVSDNGNPNQSTSATFRIVSIDLKLAAPEIRQIGVWLSWNAIPGPSYRLQFKNDLNESEWVTIPGEVTASNGFAIKVDSAAATNTSRFYRIVSPQ